MAQDFESKICGRCGGTGHYSYCQMYGTTCFECRGKKQVYTKRGLAARAYMQSLRTVKPEVIQVGWKLYISPSPLRGKYGWSTVTAIAPSESYAISKAADGSEIRTPYISIDTAIGGMMVFADSDILAVPDKDALELTRAAALEYEKNLTLAGTPRKRAAA